MPSSVAGLTPPPVPARELAALFPSVCIQGKGLLSTEAFISIPYLARGETQYPLAIRSHFFEFLSDDGQAILADQADIGGEYAVVVTTAAGLYRYQTGDRVRVTGRLHNTPCIEFLGRGDLVVDRFGEKLNAVFVEEILAQLRATCSDASFLMLAPDGRGYTLFAETTFPWPPQLAAHLETRLQANPHYAYCRRLGQLSAARVYHIARDGHATYLETCRTRGQRLGDIKPTALHRDDGWAAVFRGGYLAEDRQGGA